MFKGEFMRENYKAIRIEIPLELYDKFKIYTQKDYKTQTGVVREMIVEYISKKEKKDNAI